MDIDHSRIPLEEIRLHDPFSKLFPKSLPVLYGLKKHIRDNGFDEAFPLILAHGPWIQHDVLVDGHCRRQVCEELSIEKVPVVRRYFATEEEALAYMIHIQKDRRNLTDAEIINCLEVLDKKKTAGRPKKLAQGCATNSENGEPAEELAQSCATFQKGKSAAELASTLGISTRKLEMARTVADHGDADIKEGIASKRLSINKAYQEIQMRREAEKVQPEQQQPVSEQPAQTIDNQPEQDIDHDMVHNLAPEVNDSEEARTKCWISDIIDSLDSDSIDYVVVGQGAPPTNLTERQQVFMAPWMVVPHVEATDDAEDNVNQKVTTLTPPKGPSAANLENYDAEGWYALEKEWAKFIPGFVPEPPEGIDAASVIEETSVETDLSQGADIAPLRTSAENLTPAADTESEPKLDPRISQILDLKAKEGDANVIAKFLAQRGFMRTGSLDGIQIDRDRLLAYLLERKANTLEAFAKLLAEFQTGPQIHLPPDEDLKLYLHQSFFDYPYGAQWFWQECRTHDDNGLILSDSRFAINVLAFMGKHGLQSIEDVIRRVGQEHEARRPKPSAVETCPVR